MLCYSQTTKDVTTHISPCNHLLKSWEALLKDSGSSILQAKSRTDARRSLGKREKEGERYFPIANYSLNASITWEGKNRLSHLCKWSPVSSQRSWSTIGFTRLRKYLWGRIRVLLLLYISLNNNIFNFIVYSPSFFPRTSISWMKSNMNRHTHNLSRSPEHAKSECL